MREKLKKLLVGVLAAEEALGEAQTKRQEAYSSAEQAEAEASDAMGLLEETENEHESVESALNDLGQKLRALLKENENESSDAVASRAD